MGGSLIHSQSRTCPRRELRLANKERGADLPIGAWDAVGVRLGVRDDGGEGFPRQGSPTRPDGVQLRAWKRSPPGGCHMLPVEPGCTVRGLHTVLLPHVIPSLSVERRVLLGLSPSSLPALNLAQVLEPTIEDSKPLTLFFI